MNFKNLIMCLMICLLAFACRKDSEVESTEQMIPEPAIEVNASVIGIVIDEDGNALNDVTVLNENTTMITDENGYFEFSDQGLTQGGTVIQFEKNGYFENYKFVLPNLNNSSFLKVMMITKDDVNKISGADGGTVQTNEGASVTLPAGGIVDADGNAYLGEVSVYTHWYDPTSDKLAQSMPGDLRGTNDQGEVVQLATFGMMAVELRSSNGQELNLADGQTASLEFPVPNDLIANAEAEIPLWSLNEGSGYWEQEGTASLQNGRYIGTVSHFSFWNCDAPFPLVKLSGRLIDADGNPIKWAEICITVTTSGLAGYGWTDNEGNFCGKVPKDKSLKIEVKNECGETIFSDVFGPFSTDENLEDIVINYQYGSAIEGRLVCMGMPISNGYVVIEYGNGNYTVIDTDQDGNFSGYTLNCESQDFVLQGFDPANSNSSKELDFTTVPGQVTTVGDIETCDDVPEFVTIQGKANGSQTPPYQMTENINVTYFGDQLTIEAESSVPDNNIQFIINNPQLIGINVPISTSANTEIFVNGESFFFYCGPYGASCVNKVTVEFTELNFGVGELIEGSYILEADGIVACGNIKVIIDESERGNASISGVFWEDDGDGIRQTNEDFIADVPLQLRGGSTNSILALGAVNSNGAYVFNNLPTNTSLQVYAGISGYAQTLLNQGDPSIDNDFQAVAQDSGFVSPYYDLSATPVNENVDAGLKVDNSAPLNCGINGPFSICDGEVADLEVNPTGGAGTYTFEWSNGATDNFIVVNQPGLYVVTVSDANASTCVAEWFVEFEEIDVSFDVQQPECGDNNGAILSNPNNFNYSYQWYKDDVIMPDETGPSIDGLEAGEYTVEVSIGPCSRIETFFLENDSNTFIGDRLWLDINGNSVQDSIESGLEGISVILYDENDQVIDSTFTHAGPAGNLPGLYQFYGQYEGSYYIKVELGPDFSAGFEFVDPKVGMDDELDSDFTQTVLANGNIVGQSDVFEVKSCETKDDIDIGLREK